MAKFRNLQYLTCVKAEDGPCKTTYVSRWYFTVGMRRWPWSPYKLTYVVREGDKWRLMSNGRPFNYRDCAALSDLAWAFFAVRDFSSNTPPCTDTYDPV